MAVKSLGASRCKVQGFFVLVGETPSLTQHKVAS
jgi:hypothetical protein